MLMVSATTTREPDHLAVAKLVEIAAYAFQTPEKSVPMVRRNGARIMNIFAEGGQLICLQTHFFGSAVAVILAGLKSLGQIGPPLLFKQPSGPRRRPERFRVRACAVQGRGRRLQHVRTRRR